MTKRLPPDPEQMNDNRAEWADAALRHFQASTGTDYDDAPSDLLCDIMHWTDRNGFDFEAVLSTARMHYEAETAGTEDLLNILEDQTNAAQEVIDAWEKGDLAAAVRMLDASIPEARAAIAKAKPPTE